MSAVVLLLGLGLAITTGSYKWHLAQKSERLRAEGIPVAATLSDRRDTMGRGGGTDTVKVTYLYQGELYTKRILCAGQTGCHRDPVRESTVWVDPDRPEEFVAANGNTDDSVFFFNSWGGIPFGLLLAVLGGIGLVVVLWGDQLLARSARKRRKGGGERHDPA
ncbi:DUF3592 domain-containing protein [Micromonospora sp. NBC_01796]|uniref:DUF3592 domain-containing protein n=1 Tax=Micromonospora sp. NBC_01796 TaxID=2975987 RepID=UPI002DDB5526|nr:DUF3592 domain-containing protein [Micromonospora sp. NBC_01796]WSA86190.1 hypothetical protein OIE47_00785 [Micromonospora sp. NBC_01796]